MFDRKITLLIFAAMVLAQWYVPGSMILQREATIDKGQAFKFKCQPIDPIDPFRGKYITLGFDADNYSFNSTIDDQLWSYGHLAYVTIKNDESDFARITGVSNTKPDAGAAFFQATIRGVSYIETDKKGSLTFEFPFNRFYMEESKAPLAEQLYGEQLSDSTSLVYGLVSIYKGNAVLTDVIINGQSIKEAVENM
ncbi:MAG: GDYXXLXY domain-containing protein [Cyclobacteriaceae bacterium]|nr:GDYXXLXY domain-containing protein [Cyclobacteriaceae bacterium]